METHKFSYHSIGQYQKRFAPNTPLKEIAKMMSSDFYSSNECKSLYNDSVFITNMFRKYGKFQKYYIKNNKVFVSSPSNLKVVTVLDISFCDGVFLKRAKSI
jgi:hypothetical protein